VFFLLFIFIIRSYCITIIILLIVVISFIWILVISCILRQIAVIIIGRLHFDLIVVGHSWTPCSNTNIIIIRFLVGVVSFNFLIWRIIVWMLIISIRFGDDSLRNAIILKLSILARSILIALHLIYIFIAVIAFLEVLIAAFAIIWIIRVTAWSWLSLWIIAHICGLEVQLVSQQQQIPKAEKEQTIFSQAQAKFLITVKRIRFFNYI